MLIRTDPATTEKQSAAIYDEMLENGYDFNGDGRLSVEEVAAYYVDRRLKAPSLDAPAAEPGRIGHVDHAGIDIDAAESEVEPNFVPPEQAAPPALGDGFKALFTPKPVPPPAGHRETIEDGGESLNA